MKPANYVKEKLPEQYGRLRRHDVATPEWIETQSGLNALAKKLCNEITIGVDMEADSFFHYHEKVCLIQLATDKDVYVVDPLAIKDMSPLKDIFSNQDITKVFHGADYDIRSLYRDFGIEVENLFDTEVAARFLGYTSTGLDALVLRFFGVTLDKRFQRKDWSVRPLDPEMIRYAAYDVFFLLPLYNKLRKELIQMGRIGWVKETCRELEKVRPVKPGPDTPLFAKCKGAGRLLPRELAVLEELLKFRNQIASKKDRPPFKIISNKALIALAKKRPANMKALKKSGILSDKQVNMYGTRIIMAVHKISGLPDEAMPVYPRAKPQRPAAPVSLRIRKLKEWRNKKAKSLGIDPCLVLNKQAMHEIAEKNPSCHNDLKEIKQLKEWQKKVFGREICDVIRKKEKT